MVLADIGLIAARTPRTRTYLRALERNFLLPGWVLLLGHQDGIKDEVRRPEAMGVQEIRNEGSCEVPAVGNLNSWLERLGLNYLELETSDINAAEVSEAVADSKTRVLVYSGYPGQILGERLLSVGKRFLHVHGGYLPDYKGSTTQYFQLLAEGSLGASALFLTSELDGGPVLLRKKFVAPENREEIDHVLDNAVRSQVLVETLENYRDSGTWPENEYGAEGGRMHFVIHPVLKHLAILGVNSTST